MTFEPYNPNKHIISDLEINDINKNKDINNPINKSKSSLISSIEKEDEKSEQKRRLLIGIVSILILIFLVLIILVPKNKKTITPHGFTAENIILLQPRANDMVRLPFRIRGFVGASWVDINNQVVFDIFDNANTLVASKTVNILEQKQIEPGIYIINTEIPEYLYIPATNTGYISVFKQNISEILGVNEYIIPISFNEDQIQYIKDTNMNKEINSDTNSFFDFFTSPFKKLSQKTNNTNTSTNGETTEITEDSNSEYNYISGENIEDTPIKRLSFESTGSEWNNLKLRTIGETTIIEDTISPGYIKLYFPESNNDSCKFTNKSINITVQTGDPELVAIKTLFEGIPGILSNIKFTTALHSDVIIEDLTISNKKATLFLDRDYFDPFSSPCTRIIARKQIENTLEQFSSIDTVEIIYN